MYSGNANYAGDKSNECAIAITVANLLTLLNLGLIDQQNVINNIAFKEWCKINFLEVENVSLESGKIRIRNKR